MRSFSACVLLAGLVASTSCKRNPDDEKAFVVGEVSLRVLRLPGWERDAAVKLDAEQAAGVAARFLRDRAVSGSPRIEVVLDAVPEAPSSLEEVVDRAVLSIRELETNGQIRVTDTERRPVRVGPRRAFRITHEYVLAGSKPEIAITQVSTVFVVDGRGVTVSAIGRTELFHPLAAELDQMLAALDFQTESLPESDAAPKKRGTSPITAPVDLGRFNGD